MEMDGGSHRLVFVIIDLVNFARRNSQWLYDKRMAGHCVSDSDYVHFNHIHNKQA